MRPSKDILNLFYGLSELDAAKRSEAVAALLKNVKTEPSITDYCIGRLVGGLGSPRAASRIGFSTALVLLLEVHHADWTVEKLIEYADKNMDLTDDEQANAFAIGHVLLCHSIISCSVYKDSLDVVTEKLCSLLRQFPFLSMSIAFACSEIAQKLEPKVFKKKIFPHLKSYVAAAVSNSSPDFVVFILLSRAKHAEVLSDNLSYIDKDGKAKFDQSHVANLLAAIKKCDISAFRIFQEQLLFAARESDQFDFIYTKVIEKWATNGDESKVLERIFNTANLALQLAQNHKHILSIMTPTMLQKIGTIRKGKKNPNNRFYKTKVSEFCKKFAEKLQANVNDDEALLESLNKLNSFENFNQLTDGVITKPLLEKMSTPAATKWIKVLKSGASLRLILSPFHHWSAETKKIALLQLTKLESSEDLFVVIANCVDSLFQIKVKPGVDVTATLSDENDAIIAEIVQSFAQEELKKVQKTMKKSNIKRQLTVLWMCLKMWEKYCTSESDRKFYGDNAEELLTISKDESDMKEKVLIDLLISLLGQLPKFHRSVTYFVYAGLLPTIKKDDVQHVIDCLLMSDEDMSGKTGEMDEDEAMDEEESDADDAEEEKDEEDDEEKASSDSEEDDQAPVDPNLIQRLEEALAKGPKKDDAEDNDSEASWSDMDDEAMFAMDERLASAFKGMTGKKDTSSASMHSFRSKVTDLLLFTISAKETPFQVKMDVIVPLLELINVQLKRNTDGPCVDKCIELIAIIGKLGKHPLKDNKAIKLQSQLCELSSQIVHPKLLINVAAVSALLFSTGITEQTVSKQIKTFYADLFEKFVQEEDGKISTEIAMAAVYKYPAHFASELPRFVKVSFNDAYRISRRTEALLCCAAIVQASLDKLDKPSVQIIAQNCNSILSLALTTPAECKTRFFASVLKLLKTLASSSEDAVKTVLNKLLLDTIQSLVNNEVLWKTELKKCAFHCTQVCGKPPLKVLRIVLKSIE